MRIVIFKLLAVLTVYFGINQSYAKSSAPEMGENDLRKEYIESSITRKLTFSQTYFDNSTIESELSEMEIKAGEVVTFQAEPNEGYFFSHWEVNGQKVSEKAEFQYTMPNFDVEIIGHFKLLVQPQIRIVSPLNNATFESNKTVPIKLDASSQNGNITKVELFRNGIIVGTASDPKTNFSFTNLQIGNYIFTAKVTDERGMTAVSPQVRIQVVKPNVPPAVQIISPSNGSTFPEGTDLRIEAEALDSDGNISKVEFYRGSILIGTATAPPYIAVFSKAVSGSYTFTARAFDDKNASTNSSPINVLITKPNQLPTVAITSPKNADKFIEGNDVKIEANAADSDGRITKVEFYRGSTLIGTSTTAPYSVNWTNPAIGNYALTAKAFDEKNATRISSVVNIVIEKANVAPIVSLTSPANGQVFLEGTDVKIEANASDPDGRITKVEFYRGTTLLGTSTTAPYSITWSKPPVGNHTLTAKAYDDKNASTVTSPRKITVEKPNQIPVVTITSPENGDKIIEGGDVKIEANASDTDGTIVKVEFYRGSTLIGTATTAPYSVTLIKPTVGNYALTAKAFDNKNATRISSVVNIVIEKANVAPIVSLLSPTNGQVFLEGTDVKIEANASDSDGRITKVEFYMGITLIGTSTSAPYSITWSQPPVGNHTLTAKAFDDKNASTVSPPRKITVEKPNQIPVVAITSPKNGDVFIEGSNVKIEANASDADGSIVKVEFYRGSTLIGTATTAPYTVTLAKPAIGSYSLTAKAFDNKNASKVSAVVNIIIEKPNIAPEVSITSPKNGDIFVEGSDIKIEANASDEDGKVTKVEFYRGSTRIGTATTAPYVITWSKATVGSHTLTAKVFDDKNATTVSVPVNIIVEKANVPPTITITSPKTGGKILEGSTVKIQVNALDSDGRVTKVEFFRGSTLIGTSTVAPYVETWSNVELGTYTLTAKAFDEKGASRMSAPVTVTVLPEQLIPEIELISPFENQSFEASEVVGFTVMFRGDPEHVKRVDYYSGALLIGSSTESPFNFDWKNATSGDHVVRAVAVGGFPQKKNSSSEVNINVKFIPFEIVSPIRNSTYPTGSDLQIMVQIPNDTDKKVKRVEYFRGNQLLGSSVKEPYSFIWKKLPQGEHNLVARLVYEDNSKVLSPVIKIFAEEMKVPIVNLDYQILNPLDSVLREVDFQLAFEDVEVPIVEVEYFINGISIGVAESEPFGMKWKNPLPGNYQVIATVTDQLGNKFNSSAIDFEILKIEPRIESLREEPKGFTYNIGPNPTSDYLNLYFDEEYEEMEFEITTISMRGVIHKEYITKPTNGMITIDVTDLKEGVYLIQMNSNNMIIPGKKFIKF